MTRIAIAAAAVGLTLAPVRPADAQQNATEAPIALSAPVPSALTVAAPLLRSTSLVGGRWAAETRASVNGRAALVSNAGRNGAITGGLLGAAGGAFAGWFLNAACEYGCDSQRHYIGGGALLGAGAGALVGWGLGEAWHVITR